MPDLVVSAVALVSEYTFDSFYFSTLTAAHYRICALAQRHIHLWQFKNSWPWLSSYCRPAYLTRTEKDTCFFEAFQLQVGWQLWADEEQLLN